MSALKKFMIAALFSTAASAAYADNSAGGLNDGPSTAYTPDTVTAGYSPDKVTRSYSPDTAAPSFNGPN